MTDLAYADLPEDIEDADMALEAAPEEIARLDQFAQAEGDISEFLTNDELQALGAKVVDEWNTDKGSIQIWREGAERALKQAAQDIGDIKTFPWANAANIQYPLLTVAAQQFAARAYPAIVKGDEAVGVKVMGVAPKKPGTFPLRLPLSRASPRSPRLLKSNRRCRGSSSPWLLIRPSSREPSA